MDLLFFGFRFFCLLFFGIIRGICFNCFFRLAFLGVGLFCFFRLISRFFSGFFFSFSLFGFISLSVFSFSHYLFGVCFRYGSFFLDCVNRCFGLCFFSFSLFCTFFIRGFKGCVNFFFDHLPIQVDVGAGVNLAQAETNAEFLTVDVDDTQGQGISNLDNLFRMLNPFGAQLRDVDQTFEITLTQFGKSAKFGQVCDGTFDELTFFEIFDLDQPGIFLKLADGQTNALAFLIEANDFDFNFLTDLEHIFRMLDAFPRNLGKVNESVCAVDIDESTEISQAGNTPFTHSTHSQFIQ